jgi:hypothetical protein
MNGNTKEDVATEPRAVGGRLEKELRDWELTQDWVPLASEEEIIAALKVSV